MNEGVFRVKTRRNNTNIGCFVRSTCLLSFILNVFVMLVCANSSSASTFHALHSGKPVTHVIVVIANHLSLDDFRTAGPDLRDLVQKGALTLVNTGLRASTSSTYMALGAGSRLNGPDGSPIFLNAAEQYVGESAGDVYSFQTGFLVPKDSVVCVGFSRLWRANKALSSKAYKLGLLGDVFHENGLRTAVIGNSDVPNGQVRGAPLIAMDSHGLVDFGSVDSTVTKSDVNCPAGCRDDIDAMSLLVSAAIRDSALVVVELGDFNRVESYRYRMSDAAYRLYRSQALQNLDNFVRSMRRVVEQNDAVLVICSPKRARLLAGKSDLTPLLLYKPGASGGLLTSGTTRYTGLISNIDVGPTILRYAGLAVPKSILGQPAVLVPATGTMERLTRMERIATRNYGLQLPILAIVGALALLIATLAEVSIRCMRPKSMFRRILAVLALGLVAVPGGFLLIDGLGAAGIGGYFVRLFLAVAGLLGISWGIGRIVFRSSKAIVYAPLAIVQVLTALLLAGDAVVGTPLLRWSILSCDHITGIRYYGIGNEYMGVMIGTALMGTALLLRERWNDFSEVARSSRVITLLLFVWFSFVSFVIGFPGLGANVGGLITALVTFGVALVAITGAKFNRRHFVALTFLVIAAMIVCAVIDVHSPVGKGSHLGRTLALVSVYGPGYIVTLITGKLGMHLGLLEMRQAYIPILAGIPLLLLYRGRLKSENSARRSSDIIYRAAMPATIAGMVVGFLFNDSGIVPAALMLALFMLTTLYLRLQGDES